MTSQRILITEKYLNVHFFAVFLFVYALQIFINSVESLNSPVYSAPPCTPIGLKRSVLSEISPNRCGKLATILLTIQFTIYSDWTSTIIMPIRSRRLRHYDDFCRASSSRASSVVDVESISSSSPMLGKLSALVIVGEQWHHATVWWLAEHHAREATSSLQLTS